MTIEPVNAGRAAVIPAACRRLLVLGGGYCGRRFGAAVAGAGVPVCLTSRGGRPADEPDGTGAETGRLEWQAFDPEAGVLPDPGLLAGCSHVLVTIPPDRRGRDPVLEHLRPTLDRLPLIWVGYLSTTGVYGDRGGGWVTEDDPPRPSQPRSRARLAVEEAWRSSGYPVRTFRLPGIYGPGRSALQQLLSGRARAVDRPGQVFCRIHVDDIVGALLHSLGGEPGPIPAVVNVSDDLPAAPADVLMEAAALLGRPAPALRPFEQARQEMSPMALSFWQDNRRVSNRLLREGLGYALRFPTYREGLADCLRHLRGQTQADGGR